MIYNLESIIYIIIYLYNNKLYWLVVYLPL